MKIATDKDFYNVLNDIGFSQNYWDFCENFKDEDTDQRRRLYGLSTIGPSGVDGWGTHADVISFFEQEGEPFKYKKTGRSFNLAPLKAKNLILSPLYVSERYGPFLALHLEKDKRVSLTEDELFIGGELAALAFHARAYADPNFTRDSCAPLTSPFPRPFPRNVRELYAILRKFLEFRDLIHTALS